MAGKGAPKGNQYAKGNPGPWGKRIISDQIMRALKQGNSARARNLAEKLISEGESGNIQAIREILDRIEGKVPQAITGEGGGPVEIRVKQF